MKKQPTVLIRADGYVSLESLQQYLGSVELVPEIDKWLEDSHSMLRRIAKERKLELSPPPIYGLFDGSVYEEGWLHPALAFEYLDYFGDYTKGSRIVQKLFLRIG